MDKNYPLVSVVIPTLNSRDVLKKCLNSIKNQNYPNESIEIIISDGGSTDNTIKIAKEYGALVTENKLKTGEAGKAVGIKNASGDFIALIDSDNILPNENWLNEMIQPLLKHKQAVGSEPWEYTWRKNDGFITRYCALIGMNDPLVHFLGNYDRVNLLTGMWTEVPHEEKDMGAYLLVELNSRGIPTIGANGTVFRAEFLKKNVQGDYLFDIDILSQEITNKGSVTFIKVKNGIIHSFCESDIKKFARKQKRRVMDYLYHKYELKDRSYDWESMDVGGNNSKGLVKFILYCITFIPLLIQAIKGYNKKKDFAWFFHPLACEITLWEYGRGRIISIFSKHEVDRANWKQ